MNSTSTRVALVLGAPSARRSRRRSRIGPSVLVAARFVAHDDPVAVVVRPRRRRTSSSRGSRSRASSAASSIAASRLLIALCDVATTPTRSSALACRSTASRAPVQVLPVPGGPWTIRALIVEPARPAPRARRGRPGRRRAAACRARAAARGAAAGRRRRRAGRTARRPRRRRDRRTRNSASTCASVSYGPAGTERARRVVALRAWRGVTTHDARGLVELERARAALGRAGRRASPGPSLYSCSGNVSVQPRDCGCPRSTRSIDRRGRRSPRSPRRAAARASSRAARRTPTSAGLASRRW